MKTIAIIGKPNVGKSSLFNRIAKQRIAITSDFSGTTRDVKTHEVEISGKPCKILDTGGLDDKDELFKSIRVKSLEAGEKADIIIIMVDGKMLPNDEDKKIFYTLQAQNKPIALVINKIDNDKEMQRAWEFSEFGAQNVFPISVSHNRGVTKLLEWTASHLPQNQTELIIEEDEDDFDLDDFLEKEPDLKNEAKDEVETNEINVAIIGRVNVGKSSLLNSLVGENRAVVSKVAGTTIDPVDENIAYKDKIINFVDTAGVRRRSKIEGIEKYALMRTNAMLENADIALLVLDASEPFKELDERIANLADKNSLGVILVLNKWDKRLESYKESIDEIRDRFKFLSFAPIITVSALSQQRVHKIKDLILSVYENYKRRIPTSKLNELIKKATVRHQLPADKTKRIKIYFATQYDIKPPKIALVMNRPKALHFSYKRYLLNQLREEFELEGTPVLLYPRAKGEKDESNEA
ncbi:MAG: ribosome biogenesis GTPase Der [Sulfurospirillum sp.]